MKIQKQTQIQIRNLWDKFYSFWEKVKLKGFSQPFFSSFVWEDKFLFFSVDEMCCNQNSSSSFFFALVFHRKKGKIDEQHIQIQTNIFPPKVVSKFGPEDAIRSNYGMLEKWAAASNVRKNVGTSRSSMRRRNTWRKVARKYFCKDASNPSEPTGRNTSDSELE